MLFLYSLIYLLGLLLLFPKEYLKRPKSLRRVWLKEKLGLGERPTFSSELPVIWVHAVSVGEILALAPLLEKLASSYNILLTTITDTGKKVALERYRHLPIRVYYLPFDLKCLVKNFIKKISPKALLITETELWPNLIITASKFMPIALINGRMSDRSFKGYLRFKRFFKPLLERFTLMALQEEKYRSFFQALGAKPERIFVTGNMKFDLQPLAKDFPELENLPKPIIIAGSTHDPEEVLITQAFLKISKGGTLILVPRHPERYTEVEEKIKALLPKDIAFSRYSGISPQGLNKTQKAIILLFDKMGFLSSLYRIGDIAIIGGSFIPHGGQNPLEALYWQKPVITGPHMENFPFVREFVEKGGVIQVTAENLSFYLDELLTYPEKAKAIAKRGYELLQEKRGSTEKTLKLLKTYLKI